MALTLGMLSGAAVITSGIAVWALYKWHHAQEIMKTYTDRYNQLKEVQQQLIHHYESLEELPLLKEIISKDAENYHLRLAHFCSDVCDKYQVTKGRVMDVGSGPGALSFHLSSHFREVVGTDVSYSMTIAAQQLKQFGEIGSPFPSEGGKHISFHCIRVPDTASRERVIFWDEDACTLSYNCGQFNCVVVSNVLTDMHNPKRFLEEIGHYVGSGGLLVISDVYNWRNGPEEFLGGEGECLTPSLLKKCLEPFWTLEEERNMSYYVPRCRRFAEIGNAHVTVWKRMEQNDTSSED
ncbi:uncharacterized protein [Procambarus clarkii]|uniref:uncharacterized protein n=1 Tax=Procambarus clarkii TaxID=6728 RepID=UPI003742A443